MRTERLATRRGNSSGVLLICRVLMSVWILGAPSSVAAVQFEKEFTVAGTVGLGICSGSVLPLPPGITLGATATISIDGPVVSDDYKSPGTVTLKIGAMQRTFSVTNLYDQLLIAQNPHGTDVFANFGFRQAGTGDHLFSGVVASGCPTSLLQAANLCLLPDYSFRLFEKACNPWNVRADITQGPLGASEPVLGNRIVANREAIIAHFVVTPGNQASRRVVLETELADGTIDRRAYRFTTPNTTQTYEVNLITGTSTPAGASVAQVEGNAAPIRHTWSSGTNVVVTRICPDLQSTHATCTDNDSNVVKKVWKVTAESVEPISVFYVWARDQTCYGAAPDSAQVVKARAAIHATRSDTFNRAVLPVVPASYGSRFVDPPLVGSCLKDPSDEARALNDDLISAFELGLGEFGEVPTQTILIVPRRYGEYHVPGIGLRGVHLTPQRDLRYTVASRIGAIVTEGYWTGAAHEMTHRYAEGLLHDGAVSQLVEGYWTEQNSWVSSGMSYFMKNAVAQPDLNPPEIESWMLPRTWLSVLSALRSTPIPAGSMSAAPIALPRANVGESLLVGGTVSSDGTVSMNHIRRALIEPDRVQNHASDYSVVVIDSSGSVLERYTIALAFAPWPDEQSIARASFVVAIPDDRRVWRVQVRRGDNVLHEVDPVAELVDTALWRIPSECLRPGQGVGLLRRFTERKRLVADVAVSTAQDALRDTARDIQESVISECDAAATPLATNYESALEAVADAGRRIATRRETAEPRLNCRTAAKAMVSFADARKKSGESGDSLAWSWSKGSAVLSNELGDPVGATTDYEIVLWSVEAGDSTLLARFELPHGLTCGKMQRSCWKRKVSRTKGVVGLMFSDPQGAIAGIRSLNVTAGATGKTAVTLRAAGGALEVPELPRPEGAELVVELANSEGICWQTRLTMPAKKNDSKRFRDGLP